MGLDATGRRRRLGAVMLLAAVGMLIAGQTFLRNHLENLGFLLYWLACLAFTGMAIVVAYLDARALQRRSRREARELLESTLGKIETDARKRPRPTKLNDGH